MLTFEHEALDVGREVGMGLVAVAAGDPHEHEAASVALVLGGEPFADLLDRGGRDLDELREQIGRDRLGRRHDDRFDRARDFAACCRRSRSRSTLDAGFLGLRRSRSGGVVVPLAGEGEVDIGAFAERERAHDAARRRSSPARGRRGPACRARGTRGTARRSRAVRPRRTRDRGSSPRPTRASSASTVSIASRTLARTGATWSVRTSGDGLGASPVRAASASSASEIRSSGSGASERNGSSGPATRGNDSAAICIVCRRWRDASWNVLHSSRRAMR